MSDIVNDSIDQLFSAVETDLVSIPIKQPTRSQQIEEAPSIIEDALEQLNSL